MRLTIENYGIIENLDLNLGPGLTALIGPNGSGKSTAVDALFFALTGETIDGRNLEERINWGAVPSVAKVEFDAGDFRVTRTIKPSSTSHLLVYHDAKITKKSEINDFIFRRWNIQSTSQLKDVFFAAQLKATELFDSTDAVRLGMLSKVFGFDKLEKGRTAIYNVLANTQVPSVNEERIRDIEEEIGSLRERESALASEFENANTALHSIGFDQVEYDRVMSAPLDSQLSLMSAELEQKRALNTKLCEEFEEVNALVTIKQALEKQLRGHDAYKTFKEEESKLISDLQALEDGGPSPEAIYAALQEVAKRRVPLLAKIQELQKSLEFDGSTCPLTGGAACIDFLRMHDPQTIMHKQEELKSMESELAQDEQQLKDLLADRLKNAEDKTKVSAAIDALRKAAPELIEKLTDTQLSELQRVSEDLGKHEQTDPVVLSTQVSACEKRIAELEKLLESADKVVTDLDKKNQQQLFQKFQQASARLSVATASLTQIKQSIKSETDILEGLKKDSEAAKEVQHRVEVLRAVRDIMSRDQLQRILLQSTIRKINKEIETCSGIFSFPFSIRVADTGAVSFSTDDADDKNVAFLSGGQKYVAAVIVRLAFSRVLRSTFPFVVLDEPSTCLDDNSREMLAELMAAMARRAVESGMCLVVPTHDQLIVNVSNKIVNVGE